MGALAGIVLFLGLAPAATAAEKGPSKGDLSSAQKRADQAAARRARAQTALARAEQEVEDLTARTSANELRLSSLENQVRDLAVRQYVQGPEPAAWIVEPDLGQAARSRALLRFVSLGQTDAVDEYRAAREDLDQGRAALERRLADRRSAVAKLRKDEARATAELERLEAARRALEARLAAEARARQAAEARARRAPPPPPRVRPPVGAGVVGVIASGPWVCPVQGPRAFTNDWGQPRSGGRRHEGNDILAPRGTPVVASVAGSVRPHNSGLGGISYYLNGEDGNTYFGTHLDRTSGVSGRVAAGTVVGYVGSSGNARGGTPHLHFEIHPGGGRPVNPYSTLSRYC